MLFCQYSNTKHYLHQRLTLFLLFFLYSCFIFIYLACRLQVRLLNSVCRVQRPKTTAGDHTMQKKIWNVCFQRRSAGSTIAPQTFEVDDEGETKTVWTMADSVRPLLTSMKLFGLYFRSRVGTDDCITDAKSRGRWNRYMVYSLLVVILLWINQVRMLSVFTAEETFGPLLFFKFIGI